MDKAVRPRRSKHRLPPSIYSTHGLAFSLTIGTSPRRSVFADAGFGAECVSLLRRQAVTSQVALYVYCLMPDHTHLLVAANGRISIVTLVQRWKSLCYRARRDRGFAERFWQRGFWDRAIRGETRVADAARYILDNPVRAGLVAEWRQYPLCGAPLWEEAPTRGQASCPPTSE